MSSEELPPGIEPSKAKTEDELIELRVTALTNMIRVSQEAVKVDADGTRDFIAEISAYANAEVSAWAALPCLGEMDHVAKCSDTFEASCERAQFSMCPRRQVSRAIAGARIQRAQDRANALTRGVPEKALRVVADVEPADTDAMRVIRSAYEPRPTFLVLSGGVGCGKSCAAAWWATVEGAHFITATEFGRLSPYGEDAKAITSARRLVLDDLGAEYLDPKGHFLANLDALVDYRYAHELITVITTNLDVATFKAKYGERITDRLREAGVFKAVGGNSLRRRLS